MKAVCYMALMTLLLALPVRMQAQSQEAQQLLLNWEKLQQLRKILQNMYKGYKILDEGYTTIKDIAQGNYSLHQVFLDGLMVVSPAVRSYARIPVIIANQQRLVKMYQQAYAMFQADGHFTADELTYMLRVYDRVIDDSLRNLEELVLVVTDTQLRMSDDERLAAIDRLYEDMQDKVAFLVYFNGGTQLLARQRAQAGQEVMRLQKLYGVN